MDDIMIGCHLKSVNIAKYVAWSEFVLIIRFRVFMRQVLVIHAKTTNSQEMNTQCVCN